MVHRDIPQKDPLRARFAVWLTRVIKRARIDYYRKNKDAVEVLSLEDLQDSPGPDQERLSLMLREPNCPFVLFVGSKKLVKREEFEQYLREHFII